MRKVLSDTGPQKEIPEALNPESQTLGMVTAKRLLWREGLIKRILEILK